MTTTTVTLTGDISDAIGQDYDPRRTKVYVRHNTNKIVTDEGPIRLGGATVTIGTDGTFEIPDVVAATDLVENLQATVYVDYADTTTRRRVVEKFGPYDLSEETGTVDIRDLEAVQALPANVLSQAITTLNVHAAELEDEIGTALDGKVAAAEAQRTGAEAARDLAEQYRDEARDISEIDTSDDVVESLVKGTGGAGPKTRAALTASFVAKSELANLADPESVATYLTETAVDAEIAARGLLEGDVDDNPDVFVSVRDASNHRTWLEARQPDGAPTTFAADLMEQALDERRTTADDPNALISIRDATDHRTWLEARASDGGPTLFAATAIADRLGLPVPSDTVVYVAPGDSMTADAYGGGTTYPAKLAALLDKTVINLGSGGRRASEVAIASGGLAFPIAIPGRTIPATSTSVACTPTLPDSGPNADRTYAVTVQGVACTLTYTHATTSWQIKRTTAAGAETPVPATGAVAVPITNYYGAGYVQLLWGGRNSTTDGAAAMLAAAAWLKETGTPFLLLSVTNSTAEPSGNSSYNNIIALNSQLRAAYPREYVELRGRLITQGLALAGLSATADDTTAISQDRIPPSLLADGLHPNDAGRTAIAAIIHDELTIRGLA